MSLAERESKSASQGLQTLGSSLVQHKHKETMKSIQRNDDTECFKRRLGRQDKMIRRCIIPEETEKIGFCERNLVMLCNRYDTEHAVMNHSFLYSPNSFYNLAFGASNVGRRRSLISPAASFK